MTATIVTALLSAWCIAALFAIAFIRGADSRRSEQMRRIKRMEVTR